MVFLSHALQRTGFLLDDWFSLGNAQFNDDFWAAGAGMGASRPVGVLEYVATFHGFGRHPLPYVILLGALGVLTAVVLLRLLARVLPPGMAFVATLLWVVMPNHQSLEVWASGSMMAFSLLFSCLAVLVVARPQASIARLAGGAALLIAAIWSYEACAPVAIVAFCVVSALAGGRLRRRQVLVGLGVGVFCLLWIVAQWNPSKHVAKQVNDVGQVLPANFGYGVAPDGVMAGLLLMAVLVGVAVVATNLVLADRRRRAGPAEWAVLAGLGIMALSVLPYAYYVYAPIGIGDRANVTAAVGGALVWTGVFVLAAKLDSRRVAAVGLATVVVAGMLFVRARDSRTYAVAFRDADTILAAAHRQVPDPSGPVVFGPSPVQRRNIAAFLDQSNIDHALQVEYGRADVQGRIAYSRADFELFRPAQRIDLWRLSKLVADVDLSTDGQGVPRTDG